MISFFFYLGNVLQQASKANKNKQHGRCVEKCDRTLLGLLAHGYHQNHTGVNVRNGSGQNDEHVHVGYAVSQRTIGLDIKVSASENLAGVQKERWTKLKLGYLDMYCIVIITKQKYDSTAHFMSFYTKNFTTSPSLT